MFMHLGIVVLIHLQEQPCIATLLHMGVIVLSIVNYLINNNKKGLYL